MPLVMRRRQAGLSLVELMVALMLLAVALLGLAAAFAPGRMAIQAGDQATTAVFLARQTLEAMRNRAYDSDTDEITTANFPNQGYGGIAGYGGYRRTITIANDSPSAGLKTVTVTVFYRDSTGIERPTTLSMVFARAE